MASEDILFKTALDAIDKGERRRARDLLTRLLKADRSNSDYWIWMSAVVDSTRESIFCLQEALKLDPENPYARRGLIMAGVLPPDEKQIVPLEAQRRNWQPQLTQKLSLMGRFMAMSVRQQWAAGVGALLLIALLLTLAINGTRGLDFSFLNQPSATSMSLAQPATQTATSSTPQPTSTLPGPTPLWVFLETTYTPSPVYVNTPHPRTDSYRSALRAYQREDWEAALGFLRQALEYDPEAPDLYYYLGEAYRKQANYEQAAEAYQQAQALSPNFAPAYLGIAQLRLTVSPEETDEARNQLREALKYDPALIEAYLTLAEIYLREGDALAAQQILTEAAGAAPQSSLVKLLQGQAALLDDRPEDALAFARKAHEMDFTFLPAYRLLGEIFLVLEQPKDALGPLITYTLYFPEDAQAQTWLSAAHLALGEDELALVCVNRALQANPEHVDALIKRGEVYLFQEKGYLAIDDFMEASKLAPDSYPANAGLGRAYLLQGLDRLAYNRLSKSLDLAQDNLQSAQIYYYRALSLERLNEALLAARDWQALLSLSSSELPADWLQTAVEHLGDIATPTRTAHPSRTANPNHAVTPTLSPTPKIHRTPTPIS